MLGPILRVLMRNVKLEPGAVKCQMKTDKCRLDILMCSVFYKHALFEFLNGSHMTMLKVRSVFSVLHWKAAYKWAMYLPLAELYLT